MDDLASFLAARYDEAETIARRNIGNDGLGDTEGGGPSYPDYQTYDGPDIDAACDYLHTFRPLRMLRDITLKRAILELHGPEVRDAAIVPDTCVWCGWFDPERGGCETKRHLGTEFSDHPDYRAEWAPDA